MQVRYQAALHPEPFKYSRATHLSGRPTRRCARQVRRSQPNTHDTQTANGLVLAEQPQRMREFTAYPLQRRRIMLGEQITLRRLRDR